MTKYNFSYIQDTIHSAATMLRLGRYDLVAANLKDIHAENSNEIQYIRIAYVKGLSALFTIFIKHYFNPALAATQQYNSSILIFDKMRNVIRSYNIPEVSELLL